tara:strand:+ start:352 stop:717 length:366 start_codon:yes stop_codon:yes gene_type:complete
MNQPQQTEYCEETGETFCGKFAKPVYFTGWLEAAEEKDKLIKLKEYKIALKKFYASEEVKNNKMQKEIEVCECDLHIGRICPIRTKYGKNAYQRKRKFQIKWDEQIVYLLRMGGWGNINFN